MFEKEAEDKAFEKYPLSDRCDRIDLERNLKYEEGFQDGAEFGFQKCAKSRLNTTTISDRPAEGIIEELQAQIEKMKCCENCRYREPFCEEAIRLPFGCCCEKWELREIKEND